MSSLTEKINDLKSELTALEWAYTRQMDYADDLLEIADSLEFVNLPACNAFDNQVRDARSYAGAIALDCEQVKAEIHFVLEAEFILTTFAAKLAA